MRARGQQIDTALALNIIEQARVGLSRGGDRLDKALNALTEIVKIVGNANISEQVQKALDEIKDVLQPEVTPPIAETPETPTLHVDYFDAQHNPTHPDVQVWQEHMAWRGWVIDVDGAYGPQSEGVCRDFQEVRGLTVDGQVGPETWSATWEMPVDDAEIDAQHANSEQQGEGELH